MKTLTFLETTTIVKKALIELVEEETKIDSETLRRRALMRKPSAFSDFDDLTLKLVIKNELDKYKKNKDN